MKIFLTGPPKSGKTTLLTELVKEAKLKRGLMAKEEVSEGRRTGFNLVDQLGNTATLARTAPPTNYPVGRFYVDLKSLDGFIDQFIDFTPDELLFIDEVGQMQLYSEKFKKLVDSFLASENDFIGTISAVYEHPFIEEVKSRPDVLLCKVTPDNRHDLKAALAEAIANRERFNKLPLDQQSIVLDLARHYIANDQYISLKKLFHNALRYIAEHRVESLDNVFLVRGDHDLHTVSISNYTYLCDCDFFNGRKQFTGKSGECSHIQAVKIFQS
jgi:nucleoside-triphosphatase